jgi:dipeptidyl aminopeptidase/acylaminoacyl peptidase
MGSSWSKGINMRITVNLVAIVIAMSVGPAYGAVITFDDLYSVPKISDVQISPDSRQVAFVLRTTDIETGESESNIWVVNSDGSDLRQLTNGEGGESHPRWSPDGGSIAFHASRGDGRQVWLLPADGGEARAATFLSTGANGVEWSPVGKVFAFASSVFPDCDSDSCNAARQKASDDSPVEAMHYDHLLFRHYNRWFDRRVDRIFIRDLLRDSVYQLTFTHDDATISTLGGHEGYTFSPDGAEICYETNTDPIPTLSTNGDLFVIPVSGGEPARITTGRGWDGRAQYSPDGRYIAYRSQEREGYESDQTDLVLYDRQTGEHVNLTADFDRSIWTYRWDPKSKIIYFSAVEHGFVCIWRINITSLRVERVLGDAVYGDLSLSPDGEYLVVTRSLSNQPYEMYRYDLKREKLIRLTGFSDEIVDQLDMNRAEEFWFEGFNGDSVHGFLTLPPDFDATREYPLVLLIHGGPQWCWLGDFNYYGWNTQLMAAQGYVVAQIDPHGSIGYGIEFKEYVSGNWGRGDYEDLMLGVDYLIGKNSFIDSTRMAALGRSYGGFMTNWICGHTNRFKCLITIDGTFNHISEYGTTDELWFMEWEFKGTPWTNREEYVRSSPSTYVENFKTPTMVIHGEKDYRVDPSEALQMFTSLQRMGVPSELLYFPDEGHSIGKLENLRYVYGKQFEWLERWLKEQH